MSFSAQKFHEALFQSLFALDMGGEGDEEFIVFLMKELAMTHQRVTETYQKACLVFAERDALDGRIAAVSRAYDVERIHRVERNILRLAFYEMEREKGEAYTYEQIIGEALRLTRKFSTPEATAFVNAILDVEPKNGSAVTLSPSHQPALE